jgi:hypothetical protein
MKVLLLTTVNKVPNEKGKEKINRVNNPPELEEDYKPLEWYEDMGLKPPKEILLSDDDVDEEGFINLKEDEVEDALSVLLLPFDNFGCAEQGEELTTVYTKSGEVFTVVEGIEEIYGTILYQNMPWWQKMKYKLKRKKNGN